MYFSTVNWVKNTVKKTNIFRKKANIPIWEKPKSEKLIAKAVVDLMSSTLEYLESSAHSDY